MIFSRARRSVWGRSYGQLPIKSDYRVHDAAFEIIKHVAGSTRSLKVLDIATGTGAFAQRLADNFPAWDLQINDFERQALIVNSRRHCIDLNGDFSQSFDEDGYDLIVALEIIEHLENAWHFLRQIRKLVRKDGYLLLSTPNGDSTLDRLTYLFEGHPFYFGERGYTNSAGHITHVPDWLLKKIAASSGYSRIELSGAVDTSPLIGLGTVLKLWLTIPFARFYMRNRNDRSINIYLCK